MGFTAPPPPPPRHTSKNTTNSMSLSGLRSGKPQKSNMVYKTKEFFASQITLNPSKRPLEPLKKILYVTHIQKMKNLQFGIPRKKVHYVL